MENTQQLSPNPVALEVRDMRRWGANPRSDTKGYNIPVWLKEVLQDLGSENKKKTGTW
jgi:hypothetical protein